MNKKFLILKTSLPQIKIRMEDFLLMSSVHMMKECIKEIVKSVEHTLNVHLKCSIETITCYAKSQEARKDLQEVLLLSA